MKNSLFLLVFGLLAWSALLFGQVPIFGPPVHDDGNILVPFRYPVPSGQEGDFFTVTASCSDGVCTVTPSSRNMPGSYIEGYVTVSGAKTDSVDIKLSFSDMDTQTNGQGASHLGNPGTVVTTNSQSSIEPVSTATGELFEPDIPSGLSLGGPLPLEFWRYYASLLNANGINSRMGNNWMHNFEWVLVQLGTFVEVIPPGAKTLLFQQFGTGWQLVTREKVTYQLVNGPNNSFQFLDPATNYTYTFPGTGTAIGPNTVGLSRIQDRNGNTLTVTASAGSSQVSDGLGRILTFTYDANGHLIKVADQTGRFVTFGYAGNDLTSFTDANGKTESFAYTTSPTMNGLLTAHTLPLGNKPFSQTWDSSGRVATQSDSFGNTTTLTYNPGSTSFKDPAGAVVSHTNRNFSDFTSLTDADGQTLSTTYDSNQHRTLVTDRLGNKIVQTFDGASGNLASVTDADGNTTTYTWTPQVSGPFTYYVLSKIQCADGTSVSYIYDANGNELTAMDQAGKVWKYTYNSRGQRLTATDPLGRIIQYAYNAADGTLASITDPAGNLTAYSYDSLKRVNLITFADGTTRPPSMTILTRC